MSCGYNCENSCEECDVPDKVIEFVKGYNQALEDFINKVCGLRIYDNDLTLTDLEEVRKQLMK